MSQVAEAPLGFLVVAESGVTRNSAWKLRWQDLCAATNSTLTLCSNLQIMVLEGLHPFYDERVRELYDFSIYLDISDEVKFAWKIQRDMKERGHSLESIKASIEARRPDFDAYIDPQKKHADVIIQVRTPHFTCPMCRFCRASCLPCLASVKTDTHWIVRQARFGFWS